MLLSLAIRQFLPLTVSSCPKTTNFGVSSFSDQRIFMQEGSFRPLNDLKLGGVLDFLVVLNY